MSAVRALLLVSSVAVLGLAVGCGSSTPSQPTPLSRTEQPAQHGALAHCLSEHGVTETSGPALGPVAPPPDVDQGTWDQALQACASLAPGPPGP